MKRSRHTAPPLSLEDAQTAHRLAVQIMTDLTEAARAHRPEACPDGGHHRCRFCWQPYPCTKFTDISAAFCA